MSQLLSTTLLRQHCSVPEPEPAPKITNSTFRRNGHLPGSGGAFRFDAEMCLIQPQQGSVRYFFA